MGRSLSLIRQSGLEQRRAPYCLRATPDDRLLLLALSCFVLILASSAYFWSNNGAVAVTNCSNPDQDVGSCTCCRSVRALLPTCTTPQEEHDEHKQQQQGEHETKQSVLRHSSKCSDGVGGGCAAVTVHIRLFEAVIHCLLGTYIISNEHAYMHTCIHAYMRTAYSIHVCLRTCIQRMRPFYMHTHMHAYMLTR